MNNNEHRVQFDALEKGVAKLEGLLLYKIESFFNVESELKHLVQIPVETSNYLVSGLGLDKDDKIAPFLSEDKKDFRDPATYYALLLGLIPHLKPHLFDNLMHKVFKKAVDFPQIGGVRGKRRVFIPTLETLHFLCGDNSLNRRIAIQKLFEEDHFFHQKNILYLEGLEKGEPKSNGQLILSSVALEMLTLGKPSLPKLGHDFPARKIHTTLNIQDLVLSQTTTKQFYEIENWLEHGKSLLSDRKLGKHLKRGFRVLFHGPPGTGKTITAGVLGKRTGKPVFVVDLSMIISKYIGETEKNLSKLLNRAEHQGWILFFDEADALFGKRTNVRDAHDRYSNQETAYLLQRIEDYDGLIIMATNMIKNIDEAFLRRFQSIVHFPAPTSSQRLQLWQQICPEDIPLASDVDLNQLANRYKITGSSIVNVVHYCCLQAKARENGHVCLKNKDFLAGIRREFAKGGRVFREKG